MVEATAGHARWAGEGRLYSCVSWLILELCVYEDFGKTEPHKMSESECVCGGEAGSGMEEAWESTGWEVCAPGLFMVKRCSCLYPHPPTFFPADPFLLSNLPLEAAGQACSV